MKACRKCHLLTNRNTCSYCDEAASEHWHGYLVIIDAKNSKVAEKMKLKLPGKYALKVR